MPPAQLQSVQNALAQVLQANETGSVSSSDGRLLVLAPAATQASISDAIASITQLPADTEQARDTPIRLRFWLLEGNHEPGPTDPRLESLMPALDATSAGLGLQSYRLQGFTEVLTAPVEGFTSATNNLLVRGGATLSDAGIRLAIGMDMKQHDEQWDSQIEEDPQASAEQAGLHAALRRLPVAMLQVVLMAEFSGMSAREIARVLGIPEGTVASRRHTAMARLKQWLGDR